LHPLYGQNLVFSLCPRGPLFAGAAFGTRITSFSTPPLDPRNLPRLGTLVQPRFVFKKEILYAFGRSFSFFSPPPRNGPLSSFSELPVAFLFFLRKVVFFSYVCISTVSPKPSFPSFFILSSIPQGFSPAHAMTHTAFQ